MDLIGEQNMTNISRYINRFYLATVGLGILSAILPMFYKKEFSERGGSATSSSAQIMITNTNWGIVTLILLVIYFVLLGLAYLTIKKETFKKTRFISWLPYKFLLFIAFLWSIFLVYSVDIGARLPVIDNAYVTETAFGNVAAPSLGYYCLLLMVVANLILLFSNHETEWDSVKERALRLRENFPDMIKSPTIIQYLVFHVAMLLFMMVSYSIYFGDFAFWNGIDYYTKLFYSYGANRDVDIPWYYTIYGLFLLPFAMVVLCSFFLSSKGAGFAPNGPPLEQVVPENQYLDPGKNFGEWAFFSKDVPFAEHWTINPHLNVFYVSLLMTAFFSLVIGALIARRYASKKYKANYYLLLIIFLVVSWFYGYSLAVLSAPVFILWGGFIESAFFARNFNRFIMYRFVKISAADTGYYHPLTIFWIGFLFAIPIAATAMILMGLFKQKNSQLPTEEANS